MVLKMIVTSKADSGYLLAHKADLAYRQQRTGLKGQTKAVENR